MDPLTSHSVDVLCRGQHAGGAFVASPSFPTYRYAWFRDGSMCALALAGVGHLERASRFFDWSSAVILRFREKIERCIATARAGEAPPASECFHSRFTLEGAEIAGPWGHHQLDGLGTWLWALAACTKSHPEARPTPRQVRAAALASEYLAALWSFPCSDCWEEHEEGVHTYTLAAVYAGLRGYAELFGDRAAAETAECVRAFVLDACVRDGAFVKSVGRSDVDANLLALCTPYEVVPWTDERFQGTLRRIETALATPGLHRYRNDRYYGGGEWVLLSAWLGWVYARAGRWSEAERALAWTRAQASPEGDLPEQVPHDLFHPEAYATWVDRWGPIATPLLWSHASYLLLAQALEADPRGPTA